MKKGDPLRRAVIGWESKMAVADLHMRCNWVSILLFEWMNADC